MKRLCVALLALVSAVVIASGPVAAQGWNHDYADVTGDVSYTNVDITRVKSYESGTDIVIDLTVAGVIEDSSIIVYAVVFGSESSA